MPKEDSFFIPVLQALKLQLLFWCFCNCSSPSVKRCLSVLAGLSQKFLLTWLSRVCGSTLGFKTLWKWWWYWGMRRLIDDVTLMAVWQTLFCHCVFPSFYVPIYMTVDKLYPVYSYRVKAKGLVKSNLLPVWLSYFTLDWVFKEANQKNPVSTASHQRCFYRMSLILWLVVLASDWSYAWIWLLHLHFIHEGFVWMTWGEGRFVSLDFDLYLDKKDSEVKMS